MFHNIEFLGHEEAKSGDTLDRDLLNEYFQILEYLEAQSLITFTDHGKQLLTSLGLPVQTTQGNANALPVIIVSSGNNGTGHPKEDEQVQRPAKLLKCDVEQKDLVNSSSTL